MSSLELPALLKLLFLLVISSAPAEKPMTPSSAFLSEIPEAVQVTVDLAQIRAMATRNETASDFLKIVSEGTPELQNFVFPGVSADFIKKLASSVRRIKVIFVHGDSYIPFLFPFFGGDNEAPLLVAIPDIFKGGLKYSPWLVCLDHVTVSEEHIKKFVNTFWKDIVFEYRFFDQKKIGVFYINGGGYFFLNIDDSFIFANNMMLVQKYVHNIPETAFPFEGADTVDGVFALTDREKDIFVSAKVPPLLLPAYLKGASEEDGKSVDFAFQELLEKYSGAMATCSQVTVSENSIRLKISGIPERCKAIERMNDAVTVMGFRDAGDSGSTVVNKNTGVEKRTIGYIFERKFSIEKMLKQYIDMFHENRFACLRTESRERLELLALAFHRYLIKNNKVCPETLDEVVRYVDLIGEKALFCPMNEKKFVFNERTSGKIYQELLDGDNFDRILVHTPVGADPMGGHILYISGTVRFVSATQLDVISRGLKGELNPGEDPDVF